MLRISKKKFKLKQKSYHVNFVQFRKRESFSESLRPEEIIATIYPSRFHLLYPDEELNEEETSFAPENDELTHFDNEEQEDQLWKARTGLNEDSLCAAIETLVSE